jgi:hypothetical protein
MEMNRNQQADRSNTYNPPVFNGSCCYEVGLEPTTLRQEDLRCVLFNTPQSVPPDGFRLSLRSFTFRYYRPDKMEVEILFQKR